MFKNPSPLQLIIYISFFLLVIFFLGSMPFLIWTEDTTNIRWAIALSLIFGALSFTIIKWSLEKYIFQKINLIFKIIKRSKKQLKARKQDLELKDINFISIEEAVKKWAEDTETEIETLKSLELYRKNYVGNISHELKTPIFTIQGYIHTLLEGGLYDETVNKSFLQKAANNVERMITIVNDLEAITRMESGQISLDLQTFEIRELVKEVMSDLEMRANENEVEFKFKENSLPSVYVYGDRENIRQVLQNLITNSIKYGNKGGYVKIGFFDMDKKHVLIEVSDDGIGIDEKHIKHLFDRFYRVDRSRSRQMGGSGLGLSIVKHIVESHNQTIQVRSSLGVGTTIGFTLQKSS